MKRHLLVIVTAFVCALCPAWEGAAAAPLACSFTGTANSVPTTWTFVFPGFMQYGSAIGSSMYGWNVTTNSVANGSVVLNGGFPAQVNWGEGPSTNFGFRRFVNVTLGSNLQGTGTIIDIGVSGTFQATITITGANCGIPVTPL